MKLLISLISFAMITACQPSNKNTENQDANYSFYIGTYTGGDSQGIYKGMLREDGTLDTVVLAAELPNPSFLALSSDGKYLLAVSEVSSKEKVGSVVSYSTKGDSLTLINETTSGGAHPCFVTVNEAGYVLAANYTGGNVALVKLNEGGELGDLLDLQQHKGSDITDRQKGPHAHSAWFDPAGDGIITVDLGTNELWFSAIDTKQNILVPSDPQTLAMAPGAGPRHLVFHPNGKWIYVVNELDCTVTLVKKRDMGKFEVAGSVSTLPEGYTESNSCADIHISSDGKFVYASNRGHNSIAIFSVNPGDGSLNPAGHESTRGSTPRNFSLSPDGKFLLVANQRGNNIVSFRRIPESGMLMYVDQIEAPKPVCIRFN